jgi:hypothetical protein
MMAKRWIGGLSLALALGSGASGPAVQASVETGGDPISGVDGRDAQVMVDPERIAAWKLERLGARVTYDESKIGRPVIAVDFSGLPLSDETLKELLPLRHLRCLNLRGTLVTDEGLKTLAGIPSLRQLDLTDTLVSLIASIVKLEKAVPKLFVEYERQTGYVPLPAVVP